MTELNINEIRNVGIATQKQDIINKMQQAAANGKSSFQYYNDLFDEVADWLTAQGCIIEKSPLVAYNIIKFGAKPKSSLAQELRAKAVQVQIENLEDKLTLYAELGHARMSVGITIFPETEKWLDDNGFVRDYWNSELYIDLRKMKET